jgi:hypothetical protein
MTVKYKGAAKRIEDTDLPRLARLIGCGEDELHAIMDVEAAGSGFDSQGRVKMLFEPHVFYRCLPASKRARAAAEGLAYPKWKPGGYPVDSYPKFLRACAIDETAAVKACSWGLGQILGENHKAAGYATPQAMVAAFADDEDAHLEAMVRFIIANGMDDELRDHNWAGFAKRYNGPGYAKHGYHKRLEAAYRKWSKIKDTPYVAPSSVNDSARAMMTAAARAATAIPPPPDIEPIDPDDKPASGGFFNALKRLFGR